MVQSRNCPLGRLNTSLFSGFKMSRAGSREEDFQRMSWWGKVWVINHWRWLKVPRHLGAAPQTAAQAKPSRSIDMEKEETTSPGSLRNVRLREAESGHSSCWGYLPLPPLGTDVDLEARRGRRWPNPLSWDPSPGSKAFMIGRGKDKVSALTHERQQEAGHIDTLSQHSKSYRKPTWPGLRVCIIHSAIHWVGTQCLPLLKILNIFLVPFIKCHLKRV